MDGMIFNRVEKKYIIDKKQKDIILKEIKKYTKHSKYFNSTIYNIYYDTDNYDLIIQSIEKPEFKEKLRARSYENYDRVFLEIKTKLRGKEANLGFKRRVLISTKDYEQFTKGRKTAAELADNTQIAKEVDYLVEHFSLTPKILLYYDRTSYEGEDGLRITFDENLRYRTKSLKFKQNKRDKVYFKNKSIIMEIKANGVMPLWLVHVLSGVKAYPTSFSKIGKIYENLRKENNV